MFDIVLFAVVALFLIVKLGSVLGRRGEDDQGQPDHYGLSPLEKSSGDNVVTPFKPHVPTPEEIASMDPLEAGIAQIKAADHAFRENEFVKGARMAFEMVLDAFAKGDTKALKTLLDQSVYDDFAGAIQEREKAGHQLETTIVGIEESEIVKAEMDGDLARVSVRFVTEQVNVLRDANGEVVEGDVSSVARITDVWTFCRNTRNSDPNWLLVLTGGED